MKHILLAVTLALGTSLCAAKNKSNPPPPPTVHAQPVFVSENLAEGVSRFKPLGTSTDGNEAVVVCKQWKSEWNAWGTETSRTCLKWVRPQEAIPKGKTYIGMQLLPVDRHLEMLVYWK